MNRFVMSLGILAAMGLTVDAAPNHGSGGNGPSHGINHGNTPFIHNGVHNTTANVIGKTHFQTHGIKGKFGFFYRGRNHSHWTYRNWDPRYGCYIYWDPGVELWYYYCTPDDSYYPVSYCPYATYSW